MRRVKTKVYGQGDRPRRILLVAPKAPDNFWSMQGTVDIFGAQALTANAALPTLMALTPPDVSVEYALTDENVEPIDWSWRPDLVAITGYTLHARRIAELCRECKERGLPVAIGGAHASLRDDECVGLADYHFVGEAEHTWPRFLREWSRGEARPRYEETEAIDLHQSPAPDWSLTRAEDYLHVCVQTSRGCPFRCEFCDVILLVGRKYRTKTIPQIMKEVERVHALGAESVFFSDDNFIGKKGFTRRLLEALVAWNTQQVRPLSFSTQITMQVGDDEELLQMFADARFSVLFLGLETVREESLAEVKKKHNLARDPIERIRRISSYGIVPFVGLIVGFDHDDEAVFGELHQLLDEAAAPIAGISMLNAPPRTPLHIRLAKEGRLVQAGFSGEWQLATNIVPKQMSLKALETGYWTLFRELYEPKRFEARLLEWLGGVAYHSRRYTRRKASLRVLVRKLVPFFTYALFRAEPPVRAMFFRVLRHVVTRDPRLIRRALTLLGQFRHFYDFVRRGSAGLALPDVEERAPESLAAPALRGAAAE